MTLGASIALLALIIAVLAAIVFARVSAPRRKSRKRRTEEPIESLDPPTITHYGHG